MAKFNHVGIAVKSSSYPDDWKPNSLDAYHKFMAHVVLENLKSEGTIYELPIIQIEINTNEPVPIGPIIRTILSHQNMEMGNLLYQATKIINGGNDE